MNNLKKTIKMKKTIATIIFILICSMGYSQLGKSVNEIKSTYADAKYNMNSGYTENGHYYISINYANLDLKLFFNENNISFTSQLIPLTDEAFDAIIAEYNKSYFKIRDNKWYQEMTSNYITIELFYTAQGEPWYFISEYTDTI